MKALVIALVLVLCATAAAQSDAAPDLASAMGISREQVRVRFTEPVQASSVTAEDFTLSMGGEARGVLRVAVAADGLTAALRADRRWPYGTAGIVRLRGSITDRAGNSSAANRPSVRVWASPGDIEPPKFTQVRLTQRVVCIKGVSVDCPRSGGFVAFDVDEPVTVVLDLRRRSTDAPSTLKVLRPEGPGTVPFKEKIEGRRLRPGTYRLTVTAVDAAGNESRPQLLSLRVRN